MNTQPQLQQEIEDQDDIVKTAWICLIVGCLAFATLCAYCAVKSNDKQPESTKAEQPLICPECDSIPLKWYIYPDGTKGTLLHHPITRERGILIESI